MEDIIGSAADIIEVLGAPAESAGGGLQSSSSPSKKPSKPRGIFGQEGYVTKTNKFGEHSYICTAAGEGVCGFKTKVSYIIADHVNAVHYKRLLRCNKCPLGFYRLKSFREHFVKAHKRLAYPCTFPSCPFKTYLSDIMVEHYKVKHNSTEVPLEYLPIDPSIPPILPGDKRRLGGPKGPRINGVGGGAGYKERGAQSEQRRFYLSRSQILRDEEGRPVSYTCLECASSFKKQQAFVNHYQGKHLGFKRKCEQCDFETMWMDNLRTHMIKIHKVESVKCMIPECKFSTWEDVKMQLHLTKKHGARYDEEQHALVCYQ